VATEIAYVVRNEDALKATLKDIDHYALNLNYPIIITVDEYNKKKITKRQRGLFWAWMEEIESYCGQDKQELHDFFCNKFLGKKTNKKFNEEYETIIGTSDISPEEMNIFLTKIHIFCLENLNYELTYEARNGDERNRGN